MRPHITDELSPHLLSRTRAVRKGLLVVVETYSDAASRGLLTDTSVGSASQ